MPQLIHNYKTAKEYLFAYLTTIIQIIKTSFCGEPFLARDSGKEFYFIPWSFLRRNEEFYACFSFFETNIKDETRL